ncbi:permease prefix domain 1-containing protein [Deinococcus cellulosilyticus]|uniref:Uncharacterized protein n=1 Tax=Deinococcus cellulosilyticus (strain DSM 18568 / NBRC 106333 / KACC 11606 / 5516J-15) TaxID=1223518 RepID=A0A511N1X9_DEIC1|nr:permease prefix domain 1-containing protein [Deinococcus cellulosilyticus]GEM46527.1 hypothetical protein DC3_21620 [Deinococcus cellulosilyticus NBRC 106333 = KACC 11606]
MRELQRYLQQATRGLPAHQKQDLWQELEADILERVGHLRSFGLTEQEALQKTLAQFGAAHSIQQGMHQVYTVPRVTRWFAGLMATGSLVVLSSAAATTTIATHAFGWTYLYAALDDLKQQLTEQQVKVEQSQSALNLVLPAGQQVSLPLTEFNHQDNHLVLNNLLDAALRANLNISVTGWETLNVQLEQVKLTLSAPIKATRTYRLWEGEQQSNFKSWYQEAARGWFEYGLYKKDAALAKSTPLLTADSTLKGHNPALANQIVAAAVYREGHEVYTDATKVDAQGNYTLKVPSGTYRMLPRRADVQNNTLGLMVFSGKYTSGASKPFTIIPTQQKQLKVQARQTVQVK